LEYAGSSVKKIYLKRFKPIVLIGKIIFLLSLCFVLLYPILIMLSIAFRDGKEVFDPTVIWIPKTFSAKNFIYAFNKLEFPKVMLLSGFICLTSTALQLISCALAGYTFARFKFKFKQVLFSILLLTIIVPPQIAAIPTYINFISFDFFGVGSLLGLFGINAKVNLIDSVSVYFLTAATGAGIRSGLVVFIFIQFFKGVPSELEEAAGIDGCGRIQTFLRVILPNTGTAILTVSLFSVVWYWNDSFICTMYFNDFRTVSVTLQQAYVNLVHGSAAENMHDIIPQLQSAALISIIPIVIIYIFLQKYFTSGIETTGLVG